MLLADDDKDDCLLFQEALDELSLPVRLTVVHNGEQLMHLLTEMITNPPDIIFLDINMPRKNGFECLWEMQQHEELRRLAVVVYSTSFEISVVRQFYQQGARYYIRKPGDFSRLKAVIHRALILLTDENSSQPGLDQFVLSSDIN